MLFVGTVEELRYLFLTIEGLKFVGTIGALCTLLLHLRDCVVCWYSRVTLLFLGTAEGLYYLLVH